MSGSDFIPAEFTRTEAAAELAAASFTAAVQADPREVRLAHLEEMQVLNEKTMADQAHLIAEQKEALRIVRDHRDELVARMEEVAGLKKALAQRTAQLADATEAAESYRSELMEAKRTLRNIAELIGD